jgi:hypothetical protein
VGKGYFSNGSDFCWIRVIAFFVLARSVADLSRSNFDCCLTILASLIYCADCSRITVAAAFQGTALFYYGGYFSQPLFRARERGNDKIELAHIGIVVRGIEQDERSVRMCTGKCDYLLALPCRSGRDQHGVSIGSLLQHGVKIFHSWAQVHGVADAAEHEHSAAVIRSKVKHFGSNVIARWHRERTGKCRERL